MNSNLIKGSHTSHITPRTSQKGITLIALVITIIVLLILAGVTINMVLGEDGIIGQAQSVREKQEDESKKEDKSLKMGEAAISELTEGLSTEEVEEKSTGKEDIVPQISGATPGVLKEVKMMKKGGTGENKNEEIAIPIPKGFAYLEGKTVEEGIVVVDKYGNEFVWVPVDDINVNLELQDRYGGFKGDEPLVNDLNLNEMNGITNDEYMKEYSDMSESVTIYKGFYVGRYETGGFNTTRVVSKAGENQESCANQTWYTMYNMQKALYAGSESVVSGMIYGSQWDAIMDWMSDVHNVKDDSKYYINDSTDMGHYNSESPINTGSNLEYRVKNIYDLAGNYQEWTQEAYYDIASYGRVFRGGVYSENAFNQPASYRFGEFNTYLPTSLNEYNASRLQLYIK